MGDEQCKDDLLGAASNTVALVFELSEDVIKKGPNYIAEALSSKAFNDKMTKVLQTEAITFLNAKTLGGPLAPGADAKVATKIAKAALSKGGDQLKKQIEKNPKYIRVKKSLKDLECAFKATKFGAWVNENEKLLIIVASGMAVGGAVAMYYTRVGDTPADLASKIAPYVLKFKVVDKVEVGLEKIKFVPSTRTVDAKVFVSADLKPVKAKFTVEFKAEEDKVVKVGGGVKLVIPVGKGVTLSPKGSLATKRPSPLAREPLGRSDWSYEAMVGLGIDLKRPNLSVDLLGVIGRKGSLPGLGTIGGAPDPDLFGDRGVLGRENDKIPFAFGLGVTGRF